MRNLKTLFNPKTVVVIGASRRATAVGHGILKNLVEGTVLASPHAKPFKGKVFAVNPNAQNVLNTTSYASIKLIKENIDLAIIAVPAPIVNTIIEECAEKRVKNIIVVSAGFKEAGPEGATRESALKELAQKHKINIVGPNCLGIINTNAQLNASFAPVMPPTGTVSFISQSGALADSIIDWSLRNNYGFAKIISAGNKVDIDTADYLEFLGQDKNTKAIAIYLEGLQDGKKFMQIARKVTRKKPVILIKAGKTEHGSKAVSSHTGSLAGSYGVARAAFEQCGIHVVDTVSSMFRLAKVLALQPKLKNNSVAIITNGGGCGVLCADACEELGLQLVPFSQKVITTLDKSGVMHPSYSRANPLDIVGDALPERYAKALNVILKEKTVSGIIVIQTLQTMTRSMEDAKLVVLAKKFKKPIIAAFMGGQHTQEAINYLEQNGIPNFQDPAHAAEAMRSLLR